MKDLALTNSVIQFPGTEKRRVNRGRPTDRDLGRTIRDEIEQMVKAIRKRSRHPLRDECIVWTTFVHGLRLNELLSLRMAACQS